MVLTDGAAVYGCSKHFCKPKKMEKSRIKKGTTKKKLNKKSHREVRRKSPFFKFNIFDPLLGSLLFPFYALQTNKSTSNYIKMDPSFTEEDAKRLKQQQTDLTLKLAALLAFGLWLAPTAIHFAKRAL